MSHMVDFLIVPMGAGISSSRMHSSEVFRILKDVFIPKYFFPFADLINSNMLFYYQFFIINSDAPILSKQIVLY